MSPAFQFLLLTTLITILLCNESATVRAQVPVNSTFKIINNDQLQFSDHYSEYYAWYRYIPNPASVHDPFTSFNPMSGGIYSLYLYNTTPGQYILGMKGGRPRDEDLMRWVWDANRNHPVGENSTLSFGRDGNLVLADVDGTVAWQTNTGNKGVTGMKLLSNGNLVLYNKKGKFIWQSFDHSADTILAGALLGAGKKLVSRTSDEDGRDGKYSLVVDEKEGFGLYLNSSGKNILFSGWLRWGSGALEGVEFKSDPIDETSSQLLLGLYHRAAPPQNRRRLLQSRPIGNANTVFLRKLDYNTSISFLRLGSDGNVKAYTYYNYRWQETYAFFSDYNIGQCGMPKKCGAFGLCDRAMCVACPTRKGLLGWSDACAPPKLKPCTAKAKVDYFKIDAAEHFMNVANDDGEGPIGFELCRDKCSRDCACRAFVYKTDTKKCLQVPMLGTFMKDANTSTAYIKYSL